METTIDVTAQAIEPTNLAGFEAEIEAGHEAARMAGARIQRAIAAIRQQRLWATEIDKGGNPVYESFEHYCRVRWDIGHTVAHKNAAAGNIANEMLEVGVPESAIPSKTSHLIELGAAPPETREAVLVVARKTTDKSLRAEDIKKVAKLRIEQPYRVIEPTSPMVGKTVELDRVTSGVGYDGNNNAYLPSYLEPLQPPEPPKPKPSRIQVLQALLVETLERCDVPVDLKSRIRDALT
ncbi:MAG: hypothetical protein AAF773_00250 [Cyanobacteria bacterium P01_D01_bin.115]